MRHCSLKRHKSETKRTNSVPAVASGNIMRLTLLTVVSWHCFQVNWLDQSGHLEYNMINIGDRSTRDLFC